MSVSHDEEIFGLLQRAEKRLADRQPDNIAPEHNKLDVALVKAPRPTRKTGVRQVVAKDGAPTEVKDTAGSNWFGLPKTIITQELKRDWQLLRMRNVLDPKHQKKALRAELPKYSHAGEIIAGPTDFFSGRLTKKEKRESIAGEIMRDYQTEKFKSKYAGIQKSKMSGKKAFYKNVVSQRRKGKP